MNFIKNTFEKIFNILKSVRLAVVIIISLGVISAVGTIFEAKYDADYAQQMVYQSPYMYAVMIMLITTLIAVMVDRWPWKKRHTAFILAHIGIIITLIGAYLTQSLGVDGSLAFRIGENNRYVSVRQREIGVWSSFTGEGLVKLAQTETNFLKEPPRETPFKLAVGAKDLEILDYYHYATRESEIKASSLENDGPAVRFQLQNPNVNLTEWLIKPVHKGREMLELGPAKVVLTSEKYEFEGANAIVLSPLGDGDKDSKTLKYQIFTKSQGRRTATGLIKEGEVIQTGWMGLEFRVLRYFPKAREVVSFKPRETPSKVTNSAIRFKFDGQEYWMGANSVLRLFSDNQMYMVSWGNKRIDIGFDMTLSQFRIGYNPGTKKAATYESEVSIPGSENIVISMNEPLKYNGYTFYQASFEQDEKGEPVSSILSVNYDPGRPLKYLGSFLIVLGSIMLFYFKRFGQKKPSKPAN